MPRYFFDLAQSGVVRDPEGTDFPNEQVAQAHAETVARELMQHRQETTRYWRLDVRDEDGRRCFELLFVSVDDSIEHLTPELRNTLEEFHARSASLFETMRTVRSSLLQVQRTMALSEGLPYLAANEGVSV
jgi:uncharacterized protein DUF6894